MEKYFLIGIPCCGKTTLGRKTAEVLGVPFYDTDQMARKRIKVRHPFEMIRFSFAGKFMKEQHKAIGKLAEIEGPAVIATGAEAALMPECAESMKNTGVLIHIRRSPEIMLAELDNQSGPVFAEIDAATGKPTGDTMTHMAVRRYAQEIPQYEALADHVMGNDGGIEEGVDNLVALIRSLESFPKAVKARLTAR